MLDIEEKIQKLLGRNLPEEVFDVQKIIEDKVVMVTGAGGSIGSKLCLQLVKLNPKVLILYEMSEFALYQIDKSLQGKKTKVVSILGDLTSLDLLKKLFLVFKIDVVFHVAAYKHVPLIEKNPVAGLLNNVWGTKNLVDAARICGVENLVLVSTDKAVNPTNIMGVSKRLAEYIVLVGSNPYKVVRFGNVLWSNGSVLPLFYEQLIKGVPVTITDKEVTRYFMSIVEAVNLILQSLGIQKGICVLDMGKQIKIEHIAARLAGELKVDWSIDYIGLRPGEKLHEELSEVSLEKTKHPHIYVANENLPAFEDLEYWLCQLKMLCTDGDIAVIRNFLQKIIPGYIPSCGIVDEMWLEKYVVKGGKALVDCFDISSPVGFFEDPA